MDHKELSEISEVMPNIYLSGIYPIQEEQNIIQKEIKYIVCCVPREYVAETHDRLMLNDPEITIIYIPYNDDISQNLWKDNKDDVEIIKYADSINQFNEIVDKLRLYRNKPLIEIAYHFIDDVVSSGNKILIHCMAGVSRSVSVLSYYFMKKFFTDFDAVIFIVKQRRKIVNPNESFKKQLLTYHIKRDRFTREDAQRIIENLKKN